jgi:hypothetical protein
MARLRARSRSTGRSASELLVEADGEERVEVVADGGVGGGGGRARLPRRVLRLWRSVPPPPDRGPAHRLRRPARAARSGRRGGLKIFLGAPIRKHCRRFLFPNGGSHGTTPVFYDARGGSSADSLIRTEYMAPNRSATTAPPSGFTSAAAGSTTE